jgi:hypothetical protein
MRVDRTIRYKGTHLGVMALWERLEDQGVHVELTRKDWQRLEWAQRRLQEWKVLMAQAELLERQDREQRELLRRLNQEPRELHAPCVLELHELDRRHNREREEMGLPPRGWDTDPWDPEPAPLVSLRQMFDADIDQVGIRLRCTGASAVIAETVKEFREVAPACEVELQGEPRAASTAPLVSVRRIFGADLGQVSTSPKSTGAATANTQTVKKSGKPARHTKEVDVEPHIANESNPLPLQLRSTRVPPVPLAKARCTATADAGTRCEQKAGPDGLCLLHRLQGPQRKAT